MSIKKSAESTNSQINTSNVLQEQSRPHLTEQTSVNQKVGSAFATNRVHQLQVRPSKLEPEGIEVYSYHMLTKAKKSLLEAQRYLSTGQLSEARDCLERGLMNLDKPNPTS